MTELIKFWNLGLFANENYLYLENTALFIGIAIGLAVVSYFVGSVNFSLLISKMYGKDVRAGGSGNAGATNMVRQFGKKAGVLTFVGDFSKALILSTIGLLLAGMHGSLIAGFFCIIGHAYPVYFKFKGGKGFSSMVAIMIVTNPLVFSVVGTLYLVLLFGTRMVSFAAIMTMVIYPFVMNMDFLGGGPGLHVLLASLCAFMIIFLHRKNIVRIFNHTEPKINLSKKKKVSAQEETEIAEPVEAEEAPNEENTDENSQE